MRINTGIFGSRTITAPKSALVRPMSDKVRAALFDIVGPIDGIVVLDLYAGSGAVGLEALSRGASRAVLVEGNRSVAAVVRDNVATLGAGDSAEVVNRSVEAWVSSQANPIFDLIIADPPYADINAGSLNEAAWLLLPDGLMVVSHSSKTPSLELKSLQLESMKQYGDTALSFYKRT